MDIKDLQQLDKLMRVFVNEHQDRLDARDKDKLKSLKSAKIMIGSRLAMEKMKLSPPAERDPQAMFEEFLSLVQEPTKRPTLTLIKN